MKTRLSEAIEFEIKDAMRRRDWRKIEEIANADLRHKSDSQPIDYLMHWCNLARIFAYATKDYTWGEFEKEFSIIVRNVAKFAVLVELLREFQALRPGKDGTLEDVSLRRLALWKEIGKIADFEESANGWGASGNYPEGQYGPLDEGQLEFGIAADPRNRKVLIDFGKPIAWIAMGPEHAVSLAEVLMAKARETISEGEAQSKLGKSPA